MEFGYPLILDGATGTEIQKRGYDGRMPAELWTLEHPEVVISMQKEYIAAGSQVIYTPTFGTNREQLKRSRLEDRARELNLALAQLSLRAADGKAMVAGDIAPTGIFLLPGEEEKKEMLTDIYVEQARALDEAGVDLFVIETMMTVTDTVAAVTAVRSFSDKPIFVSCTVSDKGKLIDGTGLTAYRDAVCAMDVDAFGLNCSAGPDQMEQYIALLAEGTRLPLLAKPNAGLPAYVDGKAVYDCDPAFFASCMSRMRDLGVRIFGGCCGTDSRFIRALTEMLRD